MTDSMDSLADVEWTPPPPGTFGEDVYREQRRAEREALIAKKPALRAARLAATQARRDRAQRLLEASKESGRYDKAKTPNAYYRSPVVTQSCKNTDCDTMVHPSRVYCSPECGQRHRVARKESRGRLVSLIRYQVENGYYRMPPPEMVADAVMENGHTADYVHGSRWRFDARNHLRSREWAEWVLKQVDEHDRKNRR